MPKACTMDLKKYGDAAQTCKESPIFRMCVQMLLLPSEQPMIPKCPSPASAALPQLSYLSLPQTHTCMKTDHRLPPGASSGCLMAKNNILLLQANCTLVLPKNSSSIMLTALHYFSLPFVSKYIIYSA